MKVNKTIWLVMIALVMVGVSCTSVGYKKTKDDPLDVNTTTKQIDDLRNDTNLNSQMIILVY
jgi:hypothetical protein